MAYTVLLLCLMVLVIVLYLLYHLINDVDGPVTHTLEAFTELSQCIDASVVVSACILELSVLLLKELQGIVSHLLCTIGAVLVWALGAAAAALGPYAQSFSCLSLFVCCHCCISCSLLSSCVVLHTLMSCCHSSAGVAMYCIADEALLAVTMVYVLSMIPYIPTVTLSK